MANETGTYGVQELIEARFTTLAEFGFNRIGEILRQDLAAYNATTSEMLADLARTSTDRQGINGSSTSVEGREIDEYGSGRTKVDRPGSTVAFPLRRFAYPTGWTSRFMRNATVNDVLITMQQVQQAFVRDLRKHMKQAMYVSSNFTWTDLNVDNLALGQVKRFLNADGDPIPNSPQDGASFDGSTHTHYIANATLDVASANALIDTVAEHSVEADIQVNINRADVATWTALTGFVQAILPQVAAPIRGTDATVRLDRAVTSNRYIGSFGSSDVWVKPWAIANYALAYDRNAPVPLVYRVDEGPGSVQGLQLVQDFMLNPITVNFWEALFGFGVETRTNGAVLQFDNGTYVDPTILF